MEKFCRKIWSFKTWNIRYYLFELPLRPEAYLKPVIEQAKNAKKTKNQNNKKFWNETSKLFFKALNDAGINGSSSLRVL